MEIEPRSVCVAIVLLVALIVALLPSNPDHSEATAAEAQHGRPPKRILIPLVGRDGDKITLAMLRLKPVGETVADGWESGDARLTEQHIRYIEHWDTICFEINRAHKTGEWNGPFTELLKKSANIHSKEEALAVVTTIASPTMAEVLMAHAST